MFWLSNKISNFQIHMTFLLGGLNVILRSILFGGQFRCIPAHLGNNQLDPNSLTLRCYSRKNFLKKLILKKVNKNLKITKPSNGPACKELNRPV